MRWAQAYSRHTLFLVLRTAGRVYSLSSCIVCVECERCYHLDSPVRMPAAVTQRSPGTFFIMFFKIICIRLKGLWCYEFVYIQSVSIRCGGSIGDVVAQLRRCGGSIGSAPDFRSRVRIRCHPQWSWGTAGLLCNTVKSQGRGGNLLLVQKKYIKKYINKMKWKKKRERFYVHVSTDTMPSLWIS